ncbi:MAG: lipocalin family protein [Spirochaetales bacterium]|nr:lipocalin family protein [Spirochaetales bacterium]
MKKILFLTVSALFTFSCMAPNSFSRSLTTVTSIEVDKYMGTWYEAKRIDNTFEKNLIFTTATYTNLGINEKGYVAIKVVNAGTNTVKETESEAIAQAYIPDPENKPGHLRVAFDPGRVFFADYNVIMLGPEVNGEYSYAVVAGGSTRYLWYLVRDMATFTPELEAEMNAVAEQYGFDTSIMIEPQSN